MAAGHETVTDPLMRKRGFLLVSEAARKVGRTNQTLYRWLAEEKVEGLRDGFRRYVRWSTVLRHIGRDACELRGLTQEDVYFETPLEEAEESA